VCFGKGPQNGGQAAGLDETQLLKWANMADLMRISGVGEEYSELLEAAGVDTVKELKQRKAENLAARMEEVNGAKKLVRRRPSVKQGTRWIEQAKSLAPTISR
jgi:predicted flap endonuclease-1-like 5' DNA nuclease